MAVFHCCVHKTASQWIAQILKDQRIKQETGFSAVPFFNKVLKEEKSPNDFPGNTIFTSLHVGFDFFENIPKQSDYRVFFVQRDPRDIVVSWYFSVKYSHVIMGEIDTLREQLIKLSVNDGLIFSIDYLNNFGTFDALKSWIDVPEKDGRAIVLKFEDLTGENNYYFFKNLVKHCNLDIRDETLSNILNDYSFEKLSKRSKGVENRLSHFRKGVAGDWVNYFDDEIERRFRDATQDLTEALGYETSKENIHKGFILTNQKSFEFTHEQYHEPITESHQPVEQDQTIRQMLEDTELMLNDTQLRLVETQLKLKKLKHKVKGKRKNLRKKKHQNKKLTQRIHQLQMKINERDKKNNKES